MTYLALVCSAILMSLSLLHLYWVFGGTWGLENAVPEAWIDKFLDEKYKWRHKISTFIVFIGLAIMSIIIFSNSLTAVFFSGIVKWGTLGIGVLFLLRAIGDFNVCGIFKKKSDSLFARSDTKYFVPLCLFLGSSALLIYFFG